jgi:hypothetical protein
MATSEDLCWQMAPAPSRIPTTGLFGRTLRSARGAGSPFRSSFAAGSCHRTVQAYMRASVYVRRKPMPCASSVVQSIDWYPEKIPVHGHPHVSEHLRVQTRRESAVLDDAAAGQSRQFGK